MTSAGREFDSFVEAELPRLLGLAYALTGNPHDAWDLVQESLARVGLRWRRLRDEQPSAYARTVMVRLNIDRVRRLRREVPVPWTRERAAPVVDLGGVDPWVLDALAELSPNQRAALALRFVEDLDVAAIAQRMGCSVGTVKSHLSRGLARLRDHAPDSTAVSHESEKTNER
jgi:RNA polymerase sigma-70 factor (sigma-E family)